MAVYVLPLAHPLRIAEEVATVDQISGGRFDFGIGRSGFVAQYRGYDIDYGESEARFDEALEVLRGVFAGGRFSYEGRYYRVRDFPADAAPSTRSRIRPCIWRRPRRPPSPRSARSACRSSSGCAATGWSRSPPISAFIARPGRRRAIRAGRPCICACRSMRARRRKRRKRRPRPTLVHYFERQARLVASQGAKKGIGRGGASATAARLAALTWEDIRAHYVAVGSAAQLVETLGRWRETLDIDGVMVETNAGNGLTEATGRRQRAPHRRRGYAGARIRDGPGFPELRRMDDTNGR